MKLSEARQQLKKVPCKPCGFDDDDDDVVHGGNFCGLTVDRPTNTTYVQAIQEALDQLNEEERTDKEDPAKLLVKPDGSPLSAAEVASVTTDEGEEVEWGLSEQDQEEALDLIKDLRDSLRVVLRFASHVPEKHRNQAFELIDSATQFYTEFFEE